MIFNGIHHVALIVDDLEKAAWFYGEVLQLKKKSRVKFAFAGLFYHCGDQEIHLLPASRSLAYQNFFLQTVDGTEQTRSFVHRHAAFVVQDFAALENRLEKHQVEILLSDKTAPPEDVFAQVMIDGWRQMYGGVPIFIHDPFKNLLEIIPAKPAR